MLFLNAQFLKLLENVHRCDGGAILLDPPPEHSVRAVDVLALAVIAISEGKPVLHIGAEGFDSRLDSLGRGIGIPLDFVTVRGHEFCGLCPDALGELVVGARLIGIVLATISRRASICGGCVGGGTLGFHLLGRIFENVGGKLVSHVDVRPLAARLAGTDDIFALCDREFCFGVLAGATEDKFVDEDIEQFAEPRRVVSSIDDVTLVLLVENGLCTEFTTEKFGRICDGCQRDWTRWNEITETYNLEGD